MSVVLAVAVVVSFGGIVMWLGLTKRVREVGTRAKECLDVLRDPTLDDDTKERTLRRQSLHLFSLSGVLGGGTLLAMSAPLLAVWLLDRARVASFGAVLSVLERTDFLIAVTVVGLIAYLVVRRFRGP